MQHCMHVSLTQTEVQILLKVFSCPWVSLPEMAPEHKQSFKMGIWGSSEDRSHVFRNCWLRCESSTW